MLLLIGLDIFISFSLNEYLLFESCTYRTDLFRVLSCSSHVSHNSHGYLFFESAASDASSLWILPSCLSTLFLYSFILSTCSWILLPCSCNHNCRSFISVSIPRTISPLSFMYDWLLHPSIYFKTCARIRCFWLSLFGVRYVLEAYWPFVFVFQLWSTPHTASLRHFPYVKTKKS